MEDFYSIAIGIVMTIIVCGIAYGVGAFCAWLTQPRDDAGDRSTQRHRFGDGGSSFIHSGCNNSLPERNNG